MSTPRRTRGGNATNRGGPPRRPPNSFTPTAPVADLPPGRDIMEGLTLEAIQTIQKPNIHLSDKDIKIRDLEYVGSYNWTNSSSMSPTIIVPGSPPEWQTRQIPYQVHPDTGIVFSDQNGFRVPSAPFLPLITAVEVKAEDHDEPSFDWASIDFVTDRNGLRKLLRWIHGTATGGFRIDLQLAGSHTVLLSRWERRTREQSSGYTFGFNFEKASTQVAKGCEDGTGHHRIIKYDLNGLKMVVRFEVDACLPLPSNSPVSQPAGVDELADSLAGINISTPSTSSSVGSSVPTVRVRKGGSYVSQSSIIEMATRSEFIQKEIDWEEKFPQLFLSQTPHHFLAFHRRGLFQTIEERTISSPEMRSKERDLQPSFKKLRRALDVIKGIVIKSGRRGRLSLVCLDGELKVFERTSQDRCLPDDFMARFDA